MGVYHETLWKKLEERAVIEDAGKPEETKCEHQYLAAVKKICDEAISQAKTIRDMFPLYTLHDETHICNVIRMMENLLRDHVDHLSRDTLAMLILSACCHDIGMSCSEAQIQALLVEDRSLFECYLEDHPDAYARVHNLDDQAELPDDLLRDFLRTVHHERVSDILLSIQWPDILQGKVDRRDLIAVCQSHGENADNISKLYTKYGVDLCLCAIILRLADILDFDTSRAPQAIYHYSGFEDRDDPASKFSRDEWEKHKASHGFYFDQVTDYSSHYDLPYRANCPSMQIEQAVNSYIDWVDRELAACRDALRYCGEGWRKLALPRKIIRMITPEGYLSGQFCLTLDQDRVLELLVGKNLYPDPSVFVRELLQNAIDAVRTRQQLDRNIPRNWKPQINIHCWMDQEGYHWFRIEDNGIGMDEDIIQKYFLKVGCSYYTSSDFQREKYRCNADEDYSPISRFGIGILSCFMGDKNINCVEISTKHFSRDSNALRMSMHGTNGYYYLTNKKACPNPAPMMGISPAEQQAYRAEAGTAIAVRTNLYQSGMHYSFREILHRYVVYPEVPVHYEDENGSFDYPTEQQLMDEIHKIYPSEDIEQRGTLEFSLTDEQIRNLEHQIPGLVFQERPKAVLKCIALDQCTESPDLSGVVLFAKRIAGKGTYRVKIDETFIENEIAIQLRRKGSQLMLELKPKFPFEKLEEFEAERIDELQFQEFIKQEKSPLRKEILGSIVNLYRSSQKWYEYIEERHHISEAAFLKEFESVCTDIEKKYPCIRDLPLYQFRRQVPLDKYTIQLFDLETFPWYKQYLERIDEKNPDFDLDEENGISLTAHNGVFCDSASFLLSNNRPSNPVDIILLFKDHYRPEVNVARTEIRRLPLEAAIDLETLIDKMLGPAVRFAYNDASLLRDDYWMIPQKEYCRIIEKRPDIVDRLSFHTRQGVFTAAELPDKLSKYGKLDLIYLSEPGYRVYYFMTPDLCRYLNIAYLQKEFTLTGTWEDGIPRMLLRPASASHIRLNTGDFPPGFFLPVEGNSTHLRLLDEMDPFLFCNAAHPLSRFLINNQRMLREMVPGLYQKLIQVLAWDQDEETMIAEINMCLKRIRQLPHKKITVPDDAFLTKEAFMHSS